MGKPRPWKRNNIRYRDAILQGIYKRDYKGTWNIRSLNGKGDELFEEMK